MMRPQGANKSGWAHTELGTLPNGGQGKHAIKFAL
jgi:hypothetical protein